MPAIQPHEVLARVVAWHNSHPLALRITAAQVHSLGQVVLPFASETREAPEAGVASEAFDPVAGAAAQATVPWASPEQADRPPAGGAARRDAGPASDPDPDALTAAAASPAQAANDDDAVELDLGEALADAQQAAQEQGPEDPQDVLSPDTAADDATQVLADAPPADEGQAPEVAAAAAAPADATLIELPLDDAAASTESNPSGEPASALALRLKAARERAMSAGSAAASAAPAEPAKPAKPADRPAAAAAPPRRRWPWQGGDSGPQLSPLFDASFMWPVSPARVARWVRTHGSGPPLVPAEVPGPNPAGAWPQRELAADLGQLAAERRAGRPHLVQRHVLSAAIAVGDRRIRLLIDGQGRVLGPRAFDRRRVQALATAGCLALVVVAAMPWWLHRPAAPAGVDESLAAASAPVADEQGHAPAEAASAASAVATAEAADDAAAHAAHPPLAEVAVGHAATASASPAVVEAIPAAAASASPVAAASTAASAAVTVAGLAALPELVITHEPPPLIPKMRASGPLARIRPVLDDDAKLIARQRSAAARQAKWGDVLPEAALASSAGPAAAAAALPPGPVYALVTDGAKQKDGAEAQLAQMMSVRASLPPPVGDQGEVLAHQGRWRAAWWPFASADEAERARSALAVRGVRAEVVEF